jgi:AcrR family transcriptional regulator
MLEAVGTVGYEETSVRTVLDRAGLYRQAFYDHFSSKEDCFLQAYEAGLARGEAAVRSAACTEPTWRGQLRAGLGALLDLLDAEPVLGRALIVEVHPAGGGALARRGEAMDRARDFLDRARTDAGSGPAAAPKIAPEAIASGILMVIHSRLASGKDGRFGALLPEFLYVAVLPYFGAEAAMAEMRLAEGGA